jgi:hypothetical protein
MRRPRGYTITERIWGDEGYTQIGAEDSPGIGRRLRSSASAGSGTLSVDVVLPGDAAAKATRASKSEQQIMEEEHHHDQEVDVVSLSGREKLGDCCLPVCLPFLRPA